MTTPLMVKLEGENCVVVGGGTVATRKIQFLLKEGANVTVIARNLSEELKSLQQSFIYVEKLLDETNISSIIDFLPNACFLAVVATNNRTINQLVTSTLITKVPLMNVVDDQKGSNFFFPAYVDRGLLKIAISTSGASPTLAKKIKQQLQQQFGEEYEPYVEQLKKEREWALQNLSTEKERKEYLRSITRFPIKKENEIE